MKKHEYSVIDVETTGFSPQRGDRIVEVGITRLDSKLRKTGSFETLVNPQRDVGPTSVHGITAEMVSNAPVFSEVIPSVFEFIDGSIITAHNASFDTRFLEFELGLAGHDTSILPLCTLKLAKQHIHDLPSMKLESLCAYFGFERKQYHSALADSEAAAEILSILSKDYRALKKATDCSEFYAPTYIEPVYRSRLLNRRQVTTEIAENKSLITNMLSRLPTSQSSKADAAGYSVLLDDVLLDRIITPDESKALFELAEDMGLSKENVIEIHREYLNNLVRIALIDGVISDVERKDLRTTARLLAINQDELKQIIEEQKKDRTTASIQKDSKVYVGKSVCFTGELQGKIGSVPITRETAHRLSMERGLIISKNVTKKLDYLVVADPNTQSTKARKAREYGTSIISESVFWQMIDLQVE